MQIVTIGANEAGQRLDKFIRKLLPEAPSSFVYRMLRKKNITLNGARAEGREMLSPGDEVKFFLSDGTMEKFGKGAGGDRAGCGAPESANAYREAYRSLHGITVVYEDDHVLILNKPAGILTQKAESGDLSLNEWMIGYLLETGALEERALVTFRPSVCNRLDRNTSGLVLCGRSLAGSQALSSLIRERRIKKFYRTVAAGSMTRPRLLDGYLVKNPRTNTVTVREAADTEHASGEARIRTAYVPLAAGRTPDGAPLVYLEVELITGKTHQIRAHLAGGGHPLAGDPKYGSDALNRIMRRHFGLAFQLLHAYRLEFPPIGELRGESGDRALSSGPEEALAGIAGKRITAPLPEYFSAILRDCFDKTI